MLTFYICMPEVLDSNLRQDTWYPDKSLQKMEVSMALQPLWTLATVFSFLIDTQSAGLLGRGISLHTKHKHKLNAHKHPCLVWDWNRSSQWSSGRRRFMPQTARHCERQKMVAQYMQMAAYQTGGGWIRILAQLAREPGTEKTLSSRK
jgi:hypothetical protein